MNHITRRSFVQSGAALAMAGLGWRSTRGQSPPSDPAGQDRSVTVLNPQGRTPLSFFIDDSTCLVNLAYFGLPQFAQAWPERDSYRKPWKTWPREIPDAFVREFAEWSRSQGVKGKYSIVPYPACVGWLDRDLPGWSHSELQESLKLVRDEIVPNWDIHPEMISHTRVIDLKTGRPLPEISAATMENSYPQTSKSVDELAAYMAYALRILKNCGFACEGITTPGGFGNLVKTELSQAVGQAVRDVFAAEIPHYFKYVVSGNESTEPKLEHVSGVASGRPQLVVSVPAATGDWFGGWDGDHEPQGHLYADAEAQHGRMVELIERGAPAVMLCHWPGLYNHGAKTGFAQLRQVVSALHSRFGERTIWMKITELARYWAAKQLTQIARQADVVTLAAPFACPGFTLRASTASSTPPKLRDRGRAIDLKEVQQLRDLKPGTWLREKGSAVVCFDMPPGRVELTV